MTKEQIEILEKIKADNSKQKALDYLIKSFPEMNEDYILCEVANYEIDGFDYRNPVVHRYIAYVDAVKELQEESNYNRFQRCRECDGLHKENGNCTIVGGFYTAVPDALCPKIKEKVKLALENRELQKQIKEMKELLNRYYEVCAQIPKEYRTMIFDSCMEDTRQLSNKGWLRI